MCAKYNLNVKTCKMLKPAIIDI